MCAAANARVEELPVLREVSGVNFPAEPFEAFPFIVGWEMTLACNLRCTHCGSSAGLPRPDELTTAEALKLCDQFPALLVQEVDFTGGEPLLRTDWPVIAARLIRLGIPTNVLTNGLSLDAETVAEMKAVGISGVGISLDGLDATHDRIRNREGSFAAVVRSIELLQTASLPPNVITTVNAINLSELQELRRLLQSLGVTNWRVQPLIPMGRVVSHRELELDSEGILRLGRFVREQEPGEAGQTVQIMCGDGLQYVVEEADGRPWRGCSAGIVTCGITSDGRVKGCLTMPDEFVEGNVRERSLWDIWFDPQSFAYTRRFAEDQLGPGCGACAKATECKGGCSSSSYCSTGQFHNDSLCFYRANTARAIPRPLEALLS